MRRVDLRDPAEQEKCLPGMLSVAFVSVSVILVTIGWLVFRVSMFPEWLYSTIDCTEQVELRLHAIPCILPVMYHLTSVYGSALLNFMT